MLSKLHHLRNYRTYIYFIYIIVQIGDVICQNHFTHIFTVHGHSGAVAAEQLSTIIFSGCQCFLRSEGCARLRC